MKAKHVNFKMGSQIQISHSYCFTAQWMLKQKEEECSVSCQSRALVMCHVFNTHSSKGALAT